jgi:hypothetical protein
MAQGMSAVPQDKLDQACAQLLDETGSLFLFLFYRPQPTWTQGIEILETLASVCRPDRRDEMSALGKALKNEFMKRSYCASSSILPGFRTENKLIHIGDSAAYVFLVNEPETWPADVKDLPAYKPLEDLVIRLLHERRDLLAPSRPEGGEGGGAPSEARAARPSSKKSWLN